MPRTKLDLAPTSWTVQIGEHVLTMITTCKSLAAVTTCVDANGFDLLHPDPKPKVKRVAVETARKASDSTANAFCSSLSWVHLGGGVERPCNDLSVKVESEKSGSPRLDPTGGCNAEIFDWYSSLS